MPTNNSNSKLPSSKILETAKQAARVSKVSGKLIVVVVVVSVAPAAGTGIGGDGGLARVEVGGRGRRR